MMTTSVLVLAQASETPTPDAAQQLTGGDKALTLWLVVGFLLLAGIVVAFGRRAIEAKPTSGAAAGDQPAAPKEDRTLIRSWIAISLVGGLLIFTAISFWISDTTLRSTLIGGLVANAGAAVAFYFASKSADQARRDILAASLPSTVVPNLIGDKPAAVNEKLAATSLPVRPTPLNPHPDSQAVDQTPRPDQTTGPGSSVDVTFAGPVPDLLTMKPSEARLALEAVGLSLDPDPADAGENLSATSQEPVKDGSVPDTRKVRVHFA
jgi:hypothetical protein